MRLRYLAVLLPLLLTGCASEGFADRTYTRAVGLHGTQYLSVQAFEQEGCCTVQAGSIGEALRLEEAAAGGRLFVGHTELLCLDGDCAQHVQTLFYEEGLSPGCKVLCARPEVFLRGRDSAETVHTLRMAERDGLLPVTELATVLEEWLGSGKTALVPANGGRSMVLLRTDGSTVALSEEAAAGMRWLRRNRGRFSVALSDGSEAEITRIRLTRTAEDGAVRYTVQLRTKDTGAAQRTLLRAQVQAECDAALAEMLAAEADVIGLEELCDLYALPMPPPVTAEIIVK